MRAVFFLPRRIQKKILALVLRRNRKKEDEIFANRRAVAKKFVCQFAKKNGQLTNVKYFSERPYYSGERSYKLSSANYLRLLASNNDIIRKCAPRWVFVEEIKNNG